MTMMKLLIWAVFIALLAIAVTQGRVLLYETEDSDLLEHYDCIYYALKGEIVPYCRRLGNETLKRRLLYDTCHNGGQRWSFSELIDQGITPSTVLLWSSSIEMADNYASIFYNHTTCNDCFLCNCTKLDTFGKFCQYKLIHGAKSFEAAMDAQFNQKRTDRWGIQEFGSIVCYETLECQYGLLCLDWRNICDGEQQCINGRDEENCDKLEFNECEDDQYRCVNGMCIAEEFWLDGEPDCMDWTDEKLENTLDDMCAYNFSSSSECDEHLCSRHFWSCGDGECIPWQSRLAFQTHLPEKKHCYNLRNLNYMCEVSLTDRLWTLSTGKCTNVIAYNDPFQDLSHSNLSDDDKCIYLIRCALSKGLERDCPCNHNNCSEVMEDVCKKDENQYPRGNLIRPYISTHYQWKRKWDDKTPDKFYMNGSIKCSEYLASTRSPVTMNYKRRHVRFNHLDYLMCSSDEVRQDYESPFRYDKFCWNNSLTFNGRLYAYYDVCAETHECISQYRISDEKNDCSHQTDEEVIGNEHLCQKIRKHRFKCSVNQSTCLYAQQLGNSDTHCKNNFDEYLYGDGIPLKNIRCRYRDDQNCLLLKNYIGNPSVVFNQTPASAVSNLAKSQSHFHFYCDGKWDLEQHKDETSAFCHDWICRKDQYQCQTGQCIELGWVCDGQWDCSDASDEEALVLIKNWTTHNKMIDGLDQRIALCRIQYSTQPFLDRCDISREYPCFLNNVTDPLDIANYHPCIQLTQIGDNNPDCYEAQDEKNTLSDENGEMIGFTIRCGQYYIQYPVVCEMDICEDSKLCWYKRKNGTCSGPQDVVCLNGSCANEARCDGVYDCSFGEDEYWCYKKSINDLIYRGEKIRLHIVQSQLINWSIFPPLSETHSSLENTANTQASSATLLRYDSFKASAYTCNRGLAVIEDNVINCFCPPAYYGEYCEFFSDRISVVAHIDLTTTTLLHMPIHKMLKVKANLVFNGTTIDHHEFHYNSAFGYIKHKFYFLYSRSTEMLKYKQNRYFNRTDIEQNHVYAVHLDVYYLQSNGTMELGSWRFPVYFDFLPAFRVATVLKFPIWFNNATLNPCLNIRCPSNADCKPVLNGKNSTYCSCKSGFYGLNCEKYELKCDSYCSLNSNCKPGGRGQYANTKNPFCVCPLGHFGPRCNLHDHYCPCVNNGMCIHTHDPSGERPVLCVCPKLFYGDRCQYEKSTILINVNMSFTSSVVVVQFYDIDASSLELLIQHQQVYEELPQTIRYDHGRLVAPIISVLKKYDRSSDLKYFILYVQPNMSIVNITSTPHHCPNALQLLPQEDKSTTPPVFKYHHICRKDSKIFCFQDSNYLCICQVDHYRVDCFRHDPHLDHCDFCLSGGKCVKGDLKDPKDFICLCPHCYQGRFCEFNLQAFGFTLDSLLVSSSTAVQTAYTAVVCLLFVIGFFNNICSFVTFKRPRPRKLSIGNYLFIATVLNKGALLCLVFKFVHILAGSSGIINDKSCKSVSYLLSVVTRATYWLTSWITVDRIFIIMFPASPTLAKPGFAIFLSIVTIFILFIMHIHEIFFYTTIRRTDFSALLCTTNYNQQAVATYHRVSTLFHYFVPFFIQVISITLLIILAARSRTKVSGKKTTFGQVLKKLFKAHMELYLTPVIIILSALPQAILSFSFACTHLNSWKRHTLLIAYLLSYGPQMLGFILFVLPSSEYKKEFGETLLAKRLFKWMFNLKTARRQISYNPKTTLVQST